MKRLVVAAAFGCFAAVLRADPITLTAEESAATRALVGDIYAGGHAFEYLEVLADELGPRLAGSEQYERSVHWAAEQFRSMGIAEVRLEPVVLKHGLLAATGGPALAGPSPD
jgi:hypothetical protein